MESANHGAQAMDLAEAAIAAAAAVAAAAAAGSAAAASPGLGSALPAGVVLEGVVHEGMARPPTPSCLVCAAPSFAATSRACLRRAPRQE